MNSLSDIVKPYIVKWPTLEIKTLARKIYAENKDIFIDIEQVRSLIRYHTQRAGEKNRQKVKTPIDVSPINPYELPDAFEENWDPYYISKQYKNILVLSDIHLPYHDISAITLAIDWGKNHEVDCVLINGDAVDYYKISSWGQDPGRPTVKAELDMMDQFLKILDRELGVKIIYKYGNHEERMVWYLRRKAPELYDLLEYRPEKLYNWDKIDIVRDQRIIYAGKLPILHGHELQIRSVPVNPARSVFLKTKQSCMIGDQHKISEHSDTNLEGKLFTTWSTGCLCQLHPEYRRINGWSQGFCNVRIDDDGSYMVKNMRIYDGKIM